MPKKYTDLEAKRCIEERISITRSTWENKRSLWKEIYKLYRFWTSSYEEVNLGERTNIFVPLAFSIIETKIPRTVQALLGLDPFFKVEGRGEQSQKNARHMSDTINFQLKDEVNAFFPLMMWWKEASMYSNSYMYVGWDKEEAMIKKRIPINYATEIIGYDWKTEKETVYDGLALNHLDLFDCFPAPFGQRINGRSFERMPYFIVRSEPTANYLRSLADRDLLDKKAVTDVIARFPQGYGDLDRERKDRMEYNRMTSTEQIDTKAPRYVMYTMFEHDWWVSEIGGYIVRNKENPFGDNKIPIVGAVDTPVPHEHMGIGQIEPIIKLQYYHSDLLNLNLDWLSKSVNPGSIVNSDALLDPQKFLNDPDGIHLAKGSTRDIINTIQKPNLNIQYSSQEQINIERLIDKTLGQSDVNRGVSRPGKDTATEIVSLIEQANFRFDLSIRVLKNESMIPLLDMIASRNQMFWPFEKEIKRYTGSEEPQFMNVPVSRLIGNYRFYMKLNPMQGNKLAYAQNLMKYLTVISNDQGQHPELVKEIGKFLEIDNIDELMANPCEQAVMTIIQAANEGLLANSKQASLILAQVLNVLAPPGSNIAQKLSPKKGGQGEPATDNRGIAAQMGQTAGGAK